ncbi:SDR family NAD(P)-dependent oxidoreductase [Saccharomonospora piscinae]|uniref:Oxidoreductase n=1 Tax=Saccharomonospora piscinae TaxID=687388 RepID=A0A1V9ACC6_SACPI|nr:SDR family NAD(P)-dependent oxidoreductase [Saccharomonospora piscinae]OQO94574.1 oxidoreductase [Saccharomonospora piscinae]TLW94724.1 SDR family NAD(P)-dependent oxidoreductase [Saccharomonospora piscinae]
MGTPLVVITGASTGIGRQLAHEFARHGFDLVLTADDDLLDTTVEEVGARGTRVRGMRADLATYAGTMELAERLDALERPVDVLILNAGVGAGGPFAGQTSLHDQLRVVDLNVAGTVHLAKRLLPSMVERGSGRLVVVSSTVAGLPGPYQATYNASKAFVSSFAAAIAVELRGTGVTVTTVLPGLTDTEFFARAGLRNTKLGALSFKDDPVRVARQTYAAVVAGRAHVVTGPAYNWLFVLAGRLLPDRLLARVHRVFSAPGSARDPVVG